jgi:hypothetical protein
MTDIYVKYSPLNFKENRLNYELNAVMQCHCEQIETYCTILLALMVPRCDGLNSLIIQHTSGCRNIEL